MRRGRRPGLAAVGAALWAAAAGCVPVPYATAPDESPRTVVTPEGIFPGLDPGAKDAVGLHFQVRAYGSERAQRLLEAAEGHYNRIMLDTGLFSFKPPGLYSLVIYATHDEYVRKTQQAEWSAGVTVGNAIYSFEGAHLDAILSHEMTHLIFHEYMAGRRPELRWLNEGLAVYEEEAGRSGPGSLPGSLVDGEQRRRLREEPITFERMAALVPATEKERSVDLWYRQVGDVARFLIERGGRNGFSAFLSALRIGRPVGEALRGAYPGVWSSMEDLEAAWRRTL